MSRSDRKSRALLYQFSALFPSDGFTTNLLYGWPSSAQDLSLPSNGFPGVNSHLHHLTWVLGSLVLMCTHHFNLQRETDLES